MADIVNLQDRLKAKQDEDARYLERIDLTSRMIPVMVEKNSLAWEQVPVTSYAFFKQPSTRSINPKGQCRDDTVKPNRQ
jgi:hypothetical protein